MASRHLNNMERQALASLVESCGFPEVLRSLGTLASDRVPDLFEATEIRSELCRLAKRVATQVLAPIA
jgi:hypothetical protein